MEISKNIIIFSDFSVFSSYSKGITLDWLRKSIYYLSTYDDPFPICFDERILISVKNKTSCLSSLFISSSMCLDDTIDTMERVADLLESNETDFFCPDE